MNASNFLPLSVVRCCCHLQKAGFEVYPVGGCVRDLLLGRVPQDWDVCTSALPHQVQALFPRTVPTGLAYGTVTVVLDGEPIEVTTFRQEAQYHDGRRPDTVRFVSSLEQDLSRRDFTINAMALTLDGHLIDPFRGRDDLQAKQVRCVGDAAQRFGEDRLRMFRAIRFAAQLDFHLEEQLLLALMELGAQPHTLPPERMRPEVEKALCAPAPHWTSLFFSTGLLLPYVPNLDCTPLCALSPRPLDRWGGLAALLVQAGANPQPLLHALIPDRKRIIPLERALSLYPQDIPRDDQSWRHLLARHGVPTAQALAAMAQALGDTQPGQQLSQVLTHTPCLSTKELALSGRDLMAMGLSGPDIGRVQAMLLKHVLDCPEDNTRDTLCSYVQQAMKEADNS